MEYRGRRIVTNGKLYGIQGELITDCRYLDPQGAKDAIRLGARHRGAPEAPRAERAQVRELRHARGQGAQVPVRVRLARGLLEPAAAKAAPSAASKKKA